MIVNLSMDIEDIFGDAKLNNIILKELCSFCEREKIFCDLYVTGMKYEIIKNTDKSLLSVIKQSDYLNIGYHTNTHSFKTIPSITYNLGMDNIKEISKYEERRYYPVEDTFSGFGGLAEMRENIELMGFRAPNYAWTPQFLKYIHSKGFKVNTMDINFYSAFLFMDMVNLPVVPKPLEAMPTIEEVEYYLKDYEAVSLFLHPSRILYNEFWDKKREREIHTDWEKRLEDIKFIFKQLSLKYELVGLKYLNSLYNHSEVLEFSRDEAFILLSNSIKGKWRWSQLPKNFTDDNAIELLKNYSHTFKPIKNK